VVGQPESRLLPDGKRLHLHHGPIDLVISATGSVDEIAAAYAQAAARFQDILAALVEELVELRTPVRPPRWRPRGPVARRMMDAVWPYRDVYITPMAAVAGAVADEMLDAIVRGRSLKTVSVNNSGDIAFAFAPGEKMKLGVVSDVRHPSIDGFATLTSDMRVRGCATSGWDGRSFSLGIADAVTILARNAAEADAAATMVANAVDIDHPAIERRPARALRDDTDLGDLPVTVAVGDLEPEAITAALDSGVKEAERLRRAGLIETAMLVLKGDIRLVGAADLMGSPAERRAVPAGRPTRSQIDAQIKGRAREGRHGRRKDGDPDRARGRLR
jgi:ApbE superfamily uncharacterized protein (UPF0280 family)